MKTRVGYTGGTSENPTYIALGDHTESVQLQFNPSKTPYTKLLQVFWSLHDATEPKTQQYRSAIFVHNDKQRELAEQFLEDQQKAITKNVLTKVETASRFYDAEGYHQKYILQQSPLMRPFSHMTKEQFMDSFTAAKLNGYAARYSRSNALRRALTLHREENIDSVDLVDKLLNMI